MKYFLLLFLTFFCLKNHAQIYTDYIGTGHNTSVIVSSSSEHSRTNWNETALADNTINGQGMDARLFETSRFLAQTTFGTELSYIENLASNLENYNFSDWINDQFEIPISPESMGDLAITIFDDAQNMYFNNGGSGPYNGPTNDHFSYAWWQTNKNNEDLLRHRVALALSEIIVVSNLFDSAINGGDSGYFYDVLLQNCFGNYRDILINVTYHPVMGRYLTYFNNPKSDPSVNQYPDENYARELMQLFTIGLSELNQDGSYILDNGGNRIPTYDNDDIREFAKVFTGLGAGAGQNGINPFFGLGYEVTDVSEPMIMYETEHETGTKQLLNGFTVPNGQTGNQDIENAIDNLFNHANIAPFISLRLIQRLVKSNPTPEYIEAVSSSFNNTNGVRGDMKSVIRAIFLHPEARSCSWINNPYQGKLREPMVRYFNLLRQIPLNNPDGFDWNDGDEFQKYTYQAPLQTRSVFGFYRPDFEPNGPIANENANLFGPEFQINDSYTSLSYVNAFDSYVKQQNSLYTGLDELGIADVTFDLSNLSYLAQDSDVLINYLDKLFTHGQLSNETSELIKTAIDSFSGTDNTTMLNKSKMALWLILMSPDYAILK